MDKQEHTRRTHKKGRGGRGEGRKGRGDSPDKTQSSPTPGCIAAEAIQYHAATLHQIYIRTEWGGVGVNGALNMI